MRATFVLGLITTAAEAKLAKGIGPMMRTPRSARWMIALLLGALVSGAYGASPATAAVPTNDPRVAAQPLGVLPVTVQGTTVDATLDTDEPFPSCTGPIKGSVWYAFTAASSRSLLVALDAAGDMDAAVEVFLRQRSQLSPMACALTDRRGEATIDVDQTAGATYLIRVAPLANSVAASFTMTVVEPNPPARPPGARLPAGGATGTVHRFANPDDAWSVDLRRGVTYRLNFVTRGDSCARVSVYAPAVTQFGGTEPLRTRNCDAHVVFGAPVSGRYSVHVQAPPASRVELRYRLRVGRAGMDDTAPGILLSTDTRVPGTLTGSELDALDLYRFILPRRADVQASLATSRNFGLVLLSSGGRRIVRSTDIDVRLASGTYYLAVRALDGANGSYRLRLLARTITSASTRINGETRLSVSPGRAVQLTLAVTPSVTGPTTMLIERFDPIDGWLFHARLHPSVVNGRATVAFRPPTVGPWRVTGTFDGTRRASPSFGGTVRVTVVEPSRSGR